MHRFSCHYVISKLIQKNLGSGLGAPRPRGPLAFVQPSPMGVTPLASSVKNIEYNTVSQNTVEEEMFPRFLTPVAEARIAFL